MISYTIYSLLLFCFYICEGEEMEEGSAHRASNDIDAMYEIVRYNKFWINKGNVIFKINTENGLAETMAATLRSTLTPNDDSDTEDDLADEGPPPTVGMMPVMIGINETSENDESNEKEESTEDASGWLRDSGFDGIDSKVLFESSFEEKYKTRRQKSSATKEGLQCSVNTVNSPMKAWTQIFTEKILQRMVKHTNEYGNECCETWGDINKKDLTDFFSILFIASIQKRKDKTSNWWSNDPALENPVMKKIMTGRKFHTILRYLHVCSLKDQPDKSDPEYDPSYKVKEFKEMLEERFAKVYIPGQMLSLDETLIRSFGRIKFKVRIISKSARYGIKLYVITDAVTAFVLKIIIYTGKTTYNTPGNEEEKKRYRL